MHKYFTHNVDAGDEEGGPGHGRVEHLVREQAVLTVEREALHNAAGEVLQRLRREALRWDKNFTRIVYYLFTHSWSTLCFRVNCRWSCSFPSSGLERMNVLFCFDKLSGGGDIDSYYFIFC